MSRWIAFKYRLLYGLAQLTGRASSVLDWNDLAEDPAYEPTRLLLERHFFGYYDPYDWEPLHTFYESREQPLPPPARLSGQAAACAVEFLLVLRNMKQHRLPPDFLSSMIAPEEIDDHDRQTRRYLALIQGGERWPLGYFYTVAAHMLRKRSACPAIIRFERRKTPLLSRLFAPLSAYSRSGI